MVIGTFARSTLRLALTALGVLLIALAVLTLAARLALPFVASKKGVLEARLGDYLERPVAIGELDLAWRANGPELRLGDVSVFESETRGVRFDELLVDIDLFASLLRRTPVVDELTLAGADLSIEYAGDGRFRLHGVEREAAVPGLSNELPVRAVDAGTAVGSGVDANDGLDVLGWLFDARRVGLVDTHVTVVDAVRDRRLVVRELNVRAENDGDLHRLRIDMVLPPALGYSLEAGIDLVGTSGDLAAAEGSVYARGVALRLGAWAEELGGAVPARTASRDEVSEERPDGGSADEPAGGLADGPAGARSAGDVVAAALVALGRLDGEAQVELWGEFDDGEIRRARSRVDARGLALRARAATERSAAVPSRPLLDGLSADLAYRDDAPGWTLEADRIELVAGRERAVLHDIEIGRGARAENAWRFAAGGERLPLALAAHLPRALFADTSADAVAATIAALDPGGALTGWRASVRTGEGGAPAVSFDGGIEALSFASSGFAPGVDALDGTIRVVDGRGRLELAGEGFDVTRGATTLSVGALDAGVDIDASVPGRLHLDGALALDHASLDADARVELTFASGHSPHVDARADYAVGDLADVPPVLALTPLPAPVTRWFERAFAGGRAENGTFAWNGHLADFPHADGAGTFESGFDVVDGALAFLPDWPVAVIPRGRVELDGMALVGRAAYGRLGELDVGSATARIDDLRRPRLAFEASGRAELESFVRFGRSGPLRGILAPVLAETAGTGKAGMDVALEVALARGAGGPLDVDGALFLDGNDVTFGRADLTLEGARGSIGFSESGVRIGNLRATLFDRPVAIDAATSGEGAAAVTEVRLEGAFEASDVLSHYGIPLDRFVGGASRWNVTLSAPHSAERVARDGVRLLATSDLVGTALKLPAPLAKSSGTAVPLTLTSAFREDVERILWRIDHGTRLRAAIVTDAEGLHSFGARFGEGPVSAPVEAGFRLDGHAPRLAFDAWATALATLIEDLPESDGPPVPIPPIHADIHTDALVAGVESLGAATLRASSDATYVNAVVTNAHLAGSVRYPRAHWDRERAARVRVHRVDRAVVDALGSGPDEGAPEAIDPRTIPAIDAHVSALVWDAITLRDVTLVARPDARGLTFALRATAAGDTVLEGEGGWRLRRADETDASRPGRHASALSLSLHGEDLGAGLAEVGLPGVLAEGSGTVTASLDWEGPVYTPALERTRGALSLDVERGRIVPFEPGPARLVGLFALQALPRRLVLDFSDVTSDGLAFERITGDASLAAGVVDVSLVQLTGPVGVVDVVGTSDIVRREYDQRVTVLPRVSAAVPIIGAIAGGASGGIGALVASGFLKAMGLDLDRIGLRRYALTGSWDDPLLAPVDASARSRR